MEEDTPLQDLGPRGKKFARAHAQKVKSLFTKSCYKMGILSDAPQGFSKAIPLINALPQGLLAEMVSFLETVQLVIPSISA